MQRFFDLIGFVAQIRTFVAQIRTVAGYHFGYHLVALAGACATTLGCAAEPEPPILCELAGCNDGNPCTADTCVPTSGCQHAPAASGTCSDGNVCTTGDTCKAGACAAGTALDCNDKNPCTNDTCDPQKGCAYVANTSECDDGNGCTESDRCKGGGCAAGSPKLCDDLNPCTNTGCDAGKCTIQMADGAPCNDKDACTSGDICGNGNCISDPISCDDGNVCSADSCDSVKGCVHAANTASCDDSDYCTKGDVCTSGACVGKAVDCDDGIGCTIDSCNPATGCVLAANATLCGDENVCTTDKCSPTMGCSHEDLESNCDDGSLCTGGDGCLGGKCLGKLINCDDQMPCTLDTCAPTTGCLHSPTANGMSCTDGNPCTTADECKEGACKGAILICDDANPCTDDGCDKAKGCSSVPAVGTGCNDQNACTDGDKCSNGNCSPGAVKICDDKNTCTIDSCVPSSGCVNTIITGLPCADGNACTLQDACSTTGKCESQLVDKCNDANPCTVDSCDGKTGCAHVDSTEKCDDDNLCTVGEVCEKGLCTNGTPLGCDDGNSCTSDKCISNQIKAGCEFSVLGGSPCDDNNACTSDDACSTGGNCSGLKGLTCDDGMQCTVDSCDTGTGCVHLKLNQKPCNDGDYCTFDDICIKGVCVGEEKQQCNDFNPCTKDSCYSPVGCSHVPVPNDPPCDDGLNCTVGETCMSGQCKSGQVVQCDDGNPCTSEQCDPINGECPTKLLNGLECDDGNGCTANDVCKNSVCQGSGKTCSDGNACTTDTCSANVCANKLIDCNDGNPCTTDVCSTSFGCKITANSNGCSDGDACTSGDSCSNSQCAGKAVVCNDNNACTVDSCSKTSGCSNTPQSTGACSDGDACTAGDTCAGGKCTATGKTNCDDGNDCTVDSCDKTSGCQLVAKPQWSVCLDNTLYYTCNGTNSCVSTFLSYLSLPVAAGSGAVGCNPTTESGCTADAQPKHLAKFSAFWLDYYEVWLDKYKKCMAAGACTPPAVDKFHCVYNYSDTGTMPVNCVTWQQAVDFCKWDNKRLPTEHELEFAARGPCETGKESACYTAPPKYAWGNAAPNCSFASYSAGTGLGCGSNFPWKVGGGAAGPSLHRDLAGNVWECTSDVYISNWYVALSGSANSEPKSNPANSQGGSQRVIRGGSFKDGPLELRAYVRSWVNASGYDPGVGFRCAASVK